VITPGYIHSTLHEQKDKNDTDDSVSAVQCVLNAQHRSSNLLAEKPSALPSSLSILPLQGVGVAVACDRFLTVASLVESLHSSSVSNKASLGHNAALGGGWRSVSSIIDGCVVLFMASKELGWVVAIAFIFAGSDWRVDVENSVGLFEMVIRNRRVQEMFEVVSVLLSCSRDRAMLPQPQQRFLVSEI
jgi:hypothetical protein